jgi:hypothetical protein
MAVPDREWFEAEEPQPLAGLYEDPMAMIADHDLYGAGRIITWYRLVMVQGRERLNFPVFLHEGTDACVLETFDRSVLPLPNAPKPRGRFA